MPCSLLVIGREESEGWGEGITKVELMEWMWMGWADFAGAGLREVRVIEEMGWTGGVCHGWCDGVGMDECYHQRKYKNGWG
ncbi:hypothetical protein LIER_06053 [Lithospermum erythrorhizon]|uniref:Uncharacterized protein n=1 Tax=Lithospermum erythrorhizon TaxID=34254 RepID=A0AAV3P7I5_LITER